MGSRFGGPGELNILPAFVQSDAEFLGNQSGNEVRSSAPSSKDEARVRKDYVWSEYCCNGLYAGDDMDQGLENAVELILDGDFEGKCRDGRFDPPTQKARLLGIYMMAPTPVAEQLLERCFEPMVISYHRGTFAFMPLRASFPDTLGAVFLRDLLQLKPTYNHSDRTLFLGGERFATSPLALPLPHPDSIKSCSLTFVFPSRSFEFGALLYLGEFKDEEWRVIRLYALSFDPAPYTVAFRKRVPDMLRFLEGRTESRVFGQIQKHEVPEGTLRQQGARHFAFLGPCLKDLLKGTCEEPSDFWLQTGFAFWLNTGETVFFEMSDSPLSVSSSRSFFPESLPRCAMLPDLGDTVRHHNMVGGFLEDRRLNRGTFLSRWLNRGPLPLMCPKGRGSTSQVTVGRLRVKDPLHPVVLHSIACTPRGEVLDTVVAMAIAKLAFQAACGGVVRDMAFRSVNVVCLALTAKRLREGEMWGNVLYIMAAVWLREAIQEMCWLNGHRLNNWLFVQRLFCRQTAAELSHQLMMFLLLLWMAVCAANGGDRLPELMRPLVALMGAITWMSLLFMMRGFRALRLGTRILPVFQALWDISDFVLITAFFVAAGAHAGYSLSPTELSPLSVIFSVYRLGFLGDFDVSQDVEWNVELDGGDVLDQPSVIRPCQYVAFMVISFVVAIAMANILVGAMSSAFDFYTDLAQRSFVKHQACMGLDHALIAQGAMRMPRWLKFLLFGATKPTAPDPDDESVLWCCYRTQNMDEKVSSLRTAITSAKSEVLEATAKVHTQLRNINEKMELFEELANKMTMLLGAGVGQAAVPLLDVPDNLAMEEAQANSGAEQLS